MQHFPVRTSLYSRRPRFKTGSIRSDKSIKVAEARLQLRKREAAAAPLSAAAAPESGAAVVEAAREPVGAAVVASAPLPAVGARQARGAPGPHARPEPH